MCTRIKWEFYLSIAKIPLLQYYHLTNLWTNCLFSFHYWRKRVVCLASAWLHLVYMGNSFRKHHKNTGNHFSLFSIHNIFVHCIELKVLPLPMYQKVYDLEIFKAWENYQNNTIWFNIYFVYLGHLSTKLTKYDDHLKLVTILAWNKQKNSELSISLCTQMA